METHYEASLVYVGSSSQFVFPACILSSFFFKKKLLLLMFCCHLDPNSELTSLFPIFCEQFLPGIVCLKIYIPPSYLYTTTRVANQVLVLEGTMICCKLLVRIAL
jgi:hypothetical protein